MSDVIQTLPHSAEAEVCLLGACLLGGAKIVGAARAEGIKPEAFFVSAHREVWLCLESLESACSSWDLVAVVDWLRQAGKLDEVGGIAALQSWRENVVNTEHWHAYSGLILQHWLKRRMLRGAAKLTEQLWAPMPALADTLKEIVPTLGHLQTLTVRVTAKDPDAPFIEVRELAEAAVEGKAPPNPPRTVSSNLRTLEREYGPLVCGELTGIAARPSVGKSSLVRGHYEWPALYAGKNVATFCMEMSELQWIARATATQAQVNYRKPETGKPGSAKEWLGHVKWLHSVRNKQYFLHGGRMTVDMMRVHARAAAQKCGGLDLIIVDYLQYVDLNLGNKRWSRDEAIGDAVVQIKVMGQELKSAVALVIAINRESTKDNKEPSMANLRGSGETEYHLDKLLLLHRPNVDHTGNEQGRDRDWNEVHIICDKNRDGERGWHRFNFRGSCTRFYDLPDGVSTKVSPAVEHAGRGSDTGARGKPKKSKADTEQYIQSPYED